MKQALSAFVLLGAFGGVGCSASSAGGSSDAGALSPDAFSVAHDAAAKTPADAAVTTTTHDSAAPAVPADESAWLTPMNQARAAVGEAPFAWDSLAAQVAATYAAGCNFAHNASASSQYAALGGSGGLGENIAAGAPTETPAAAVASWLSEAPSYNHATNTCAAGQSCGHYTQIVWKASTGVGCAHVSCTTNSPFGGGDWDFLVCDFSPPGNMSGEAPY